MRKKRRGNKMTEEAFVGMRDEPEVSPPILFKLKKQTKRKIKEKEQPQESKSMFGKSMGKCEEGRSPAIEHIALKARLGFENFS
jgi:hypothetical protein